MAIVAIFMLTTAVSVFLPTVELILMSISVMNTMSHVITEFSFGNYFPEIIQALDNSFEVTHDSLSLAYLECPRSVPTKFVAYQYYLGVVPTTHVAPRSQPLHTNQYSVTHYERKLTPHSSVPGIFFKFNIEPVRLTLIQRTTTLVQFFIRSVTLSFIRRPRTLLISGSTAVSALSVAYSSAHPGASVRQTR